MTDFSSLTSSQPHEGGAAIRLPHNRQQIQRETCSTERQAGQLLVQIPHRGCSHGPWPGLAPHPAQKTQKAAKASLGTCVVIVHFLCSINKSEPLAVVQQSKTSPWTVQIEGSTGPLAPWQIPPPYGQIPPMWEEGGWGAMGQQEGGQGGL